MDPSADNLEPSDLVRSLQRGTQVTWAASGMEGAVELTLTGQTEGGVAGDPRAALMQRLLLPAPASEKISPASRVL